MHKYIVKYVQVKKVLPLFYPNHRGFWRACAHVHLFIGRYVSVYTFLNARDYQLKENKTHFIQRIS